MMSLASRELRNSLGVIVPDCTLSLGCRSLDTSYNQLPSLVTMKMFTSALCSSPVSCVGKRKSRAGQPTGVRPQYRLISSGGRLRVETIRCGREKFDNFLIT